MSHEEPGVVAENLDEVKNLVFLLHRIAKYLQYQE